MKRILTILLAAILMCLCVIPALAAGEISVIVRGSRVSWTDAVPFIDSNSRTLCPLRDVGEAMGLTVEWDAESRSAGFTKTGISTDEYGREYSYVESVLFTIGESTAAYEISKYYADGYDEHSHWPIEMDTAAVIRNNRTYAPIRYLAEAFGYTVGWEGVSRTVTLDYSYISTPYYANEYDLGLSLRLDPDKGYENVAKVEIIYAGINGRETVIETVIDKYIPHGAIYEVGIFTGGELTAMDTVETKYRVTLKDGSSVLRSFVQEYRCFFPGDVVPQFA